jgi:hypothetical protein
MFRYAQIIRELGPALVIATEEHPALPAAHQAGVKSVFLGTWLPNDGRVTIYSESIGYADHLFLLGRPGDQAAPPSANAAPFYLGFYTRHCAEKDARRRTREELGLSENDVLVAFSTEGGFTEELYPFAQVVSDAIAQLPFADRVRLAIFTDDSLPTQFVEKGLMVLREKAFPRFVSAVDVAVLKGGYQACVDCAAAGVPAISIRLSSTQIDDYLVSKVRGNVALTARAVDAGVLASYLRSALSQERARAVLPLKETFSTASGIADALVDVLESKLVPAL